LRRIFRARQSAPHRQRADEGIAASLREKDALLREAQHRVNNTMQMVSSLLQLQANYIEDPKLLESFQDCRDRIRAMALVYQNLHRNGASAQIDFKEYLETLMDMLLRAQSKGVKVRRQFNLEPAALGIDTAIPLGLIANELISNSLKRGFAGRHEGVVRISLGRVGQDQFRLAIGDDGCGATGGIFEGNSLGLRLVKVLTGQIRGHMEYKIESGTEFVIEFKDANSKST